MSANLIRVIDNPPGIRGGVVWNRLHSERENICEALLKEGFQASFETQLRQWCLSTKEARDNANWHPELLQARLRKIDDALDRLISGSYGSCSQCSRWIEDTKLEFDPAIAFCVSCWEREQSHGRVEYHLSAKPASASLPNLVDLWNK